MMIKEVKSKFKCKRGISLPFGYVLADIMSDSMAERYGLNPKKSWDYAQCPKCFKEYVREVFK